MGALAPSGRPLARAMATAAELGGKRILEIGPGTGVITEALLDAGAEPEQLSLLERDCRLASNLASKFPDLKVITGDARFLEQILETEQPQPFDIVFSSLPLLNMKKSEKHSILTQILALLDERGILIQYSYSARPPLSENLTRELGITGMRAATVIRNLPPARVWKYSRPLN
ncbi:MAG: phospholipid methyltransferase [Sneathiella sp.]|uniref:class I SAM-dependent methyltransferase n=1 Tax=Sneathiella sp. TaxID=1964365 RepID=UPI000C432BAF|nr:rRNA adenine N-6-methyltransferase family protein [Sneathiella sp.]MAL77976.1 phospholipid methyltransferase [Sneathiella sp.]